VAAAGVGGVPEAPRLGSARGC